MSNYLLENDFLVSSNMHQASLKIVNEIKNYCDDIKIDNFSNIIAHKKADGEKLIISVALDGCGFLYCGKNESNKLRMGALGKADYKFVKDNMLVSKDEVYITAKKDDCEKNLITDIEFEADEDNVEKLEISQAFKFCGGIIEDEKKVMGMYASKIVMADLIVDFIKTIKTDYDLYFVILVNQKSVTNCMGAITKSILPKYHINIHFENKSDFGVYSAARVKGACINKQLTNALNLEKTLVNDPVYELITSQNVENGVVCACICISVKNLDAIETIMKSDCDKLKCVLEKILSGETDDNKL